MNSKASLIFLAVALSLSLSACSGGGRARSITNLCGDPSQPLSIVDNSLVGKVEVKPGTPLELQAADYAYDGADVFYYDYNNDISLQFTHKSKDGKFESKTACVGGRGFKPSMAPIDRMNVTFVSNILLNDKGESFVRKSNFWFTVRRPTGNGLGWTDSGVEIVDKTYIPGSPSDTYNGKPFVRQFMLAVKDPNNEVNFAPYRWTSFINDRFFPLKLEDKGPQDNVNDAEPLIRVSVRMKPVSAAERESLDGQ